MVTQIVQTNIAKFLALAVLLCLVVAGSAQAQEPEPLLPGRVEGTGTHFEVTDSEYLNVVLDSSESINLVLESVPNTIFMEIEAASGAASAQITLGGFAASTTYYKYVDDGTTHEAFDTDANGSYTYTQDLTQRHLIFIMPGPSTKIIEDVPGGRDCHLIGNWDPGTKTCTLHPGLPITESIFIHSNGVTLDGNGREIRGYGYGNGVYLSNRSGVTVKDLIIRNFSHGIYVYQSSAVTLTGNNINANRSTGIYLFRANGNTVADNDVSANNVSGIRLDYSSSNHLTGNTVSNNGYHGFYLSYANNNNLTGNAVSGHPWGTLLYDYSQGNTLTDNTITNSINRGLGLNRNANNNRVYNNSFINNGQYQIHVYASGGNIFNMNPPVGGNYYDDFDTPSEGCDNNNGDTFCDAPFNFPGGRDYYPWTGQDGWTAPINQPPAVDAGGPYSGDEGSAIALSGATASDPDGDSLTYAWTVDSPLCAFSDAATPNPTLTCNDDGTINATLTVDDGSETASDATVITVNNVAPTVTVAGPTEASEGESGNYSATVSDPGGQDSHTVEWDCDGDGDFDDGSGLTVDCNFANGPATVAVTAQAADDDGGSSTSALDVAVNNVAPSLGPISVSAELVEVGASIDASADFTDPGALDTHTADWDWGDGSSSGGAVTETDGSGVAEDSHTYTEPGVYTVKVRLADSDGDADAVAYLYVVVFDPAGGYVTGSGSINSPEGAYAPDPSLTGPANFGFFSKYKNGANQPTGKTQFQFQLADLNFFSDSHDWLVVAGPKAQFKGTGTINGTGNYGFMITATDEKFTPSTDKDRFRIKIWDKDAGDGVVYDNKMNEPDDSDAGDDLASGKIVIHK